MENKNTQAIVGAIVLAGVLIAGALLLRGSSAPVAVNIPQNGVGAPLVTAAPAPLSVKEVDRSLGNPQSPNSVVLIMYEDFQCPFCGRFFNDSEKQIRDTYVKDGRVILVYRDFAFLGPESEKAAEAARCAEDQGKFWEFHDYLFTHQNGENQGSFADPKLKSFAKTLGLNTASFNSCLDSGKYAQAVADSKTEAAAAGVNGTPKGFILKDGKVVNIINGAEPFTMVKAKLDAALK